MLDTRDLLDVINVGQVALKCDCVDELGKKVLELVPRIFRVERGVFFRARQCPSPRLDYDHFASKGIEQQYVSLFRTYFYKVDPFLKTLGGGKTVVTTSDVVSSKELMRSEYYGGFLKPQSIGHEMAIYLRSGRRLLGTLAVMRSMYEDDFSAGDRSKGELLASHLAGALEKSILADKVGKAYEMIRSICADLPYKGVLALDDSLEPIYMDDEARKAISALSEEKDLRERAPFTLPEALRVPCRQLMEDSMRKGSASGSRVVGIPGRKTGSTAVMNLRFIRHSGDSGFFLLCLDRNKPGDHLSEHLGKYGITRSEVEIIGLVCKGFKNGEIAEKQFICEGTVENHLHSIYEKLNVRNRASLVNFVAGLRYSR
jgi:DNA-binding CsgD family transcriptional regulator